jgi:hypothetical protein
VVSRQPQASAALPPGKETPVPTAEEAVWVRNSVLLAEVIWGLGP